MSRLLTLTFVLAAAVVLAQGAPDVPLPAPLPGARLIDTKPIDQPLELKQATAEDEAVIAGQQYVQYTYERPNTVMPIVFVHTIRDALFIAGWKLIEVTKLEEIPFQPETVNVAAHYRENGRNVFTRYTQEPGGPYQVNVADIDAEDWATQLENDCRVRVHSLQFAHDRAELKLLESEPTLRKLAALIKQQTTTRVQVQGHVDNVGEAAAAEREALSAARAKAVAGWLTVQGGVPASKVTAAGLGRSRPIADNDSDLGRALNRRIEVARQDCAR